MDYDEEKIDEVIMALLFLNSTSDQYGMRAWKSYSWDAMDRLYEKGYISNPKSKALSVVLTDEGEKMAKKMFEKYFAIEGKSP